MIPEDIVDEPPLAFAYEEGGVSEGAASFAVPRSRNSTCRETRAFSKQRRRKRTWLSPGTTSTPHARIRSEKGIRWGGRPLATAA
ncbi:hypothetical protein [Streptomyces sp. IBSNAI001]|uniref:hypothetical protein n=1 Tax=Streptomyces sp. IBSNAI001 TaxID=3457499 RepID=UPI003FD2FC00